MHPVLGLFRHNAWATWRLLDFCEGRPEAAAPAEGDVYGGIEPMFNHILSGETGYLRQLVLSAPGTCGSIGATLDRRLPIEAPGRAA